MSLNLFLDQDILATTGVAVQLPPSNVMSETVVLLGEPEKLGSALTTVYNKVGASISPTIFYKLTLQANSVAINEISADAWLHRHIIGKGGSVFKPINEKYPHVSPSFP